MRYALLLVFTLICCTAGAQKANDTFSVYFDLDVPELNARATKKLDSLLKNNKISREKQLSIIGYADYLATDEYNLELSRNRAESVKGYLVSAEYNPKNIQLLVGRGEVKRKDTVDRPKGVAADRRVDIVVLSTPRPTRRITDTTIIMKPRVAIPPSSDDPNFDITEIPIGRTFILKNIYFPMGRHFPKESSSTDLIMLLEAMKENPYLVIKIEGHVCCVTNVPDALDLDSRKIDLSVNRARFIYEYLKARGISADRLSYEGYGKSRPIVADEQTAEEAAMNRRVEIRILER